jgi:hypothetical protein
MAMTTASQDPKYTAAKRVYDKAHKALAGAHEFLQSTAGEDDDNTFQADQLLDRMGKLVNAEFTTITKACGVGVYQPYGGRGRVRRY